MIGLDGRQMTKAMLCVAGMVTNSLMTVTMVVMNQEPVWVLLTLVWMSLNVEWAPATWDWTNNLGEILGPATYDWMNQGEILEPATNQGEVWGAVTKIVGVRLPVMIPLVTGLIAISSWDPTGMTRITTAVTQAATLTSVVVGATVDRRGKIAGVTVVAEERGGGSAGRAGRAERDGRDKESGRGGRDKERGGDEWRRGPPREEHGPPRDERGPPRDERGPPREERGPPREERGPPREERGPPRDDLIGRGNYTLLCVLFKHGGTMFNAGRSL